MLALKAVGFIYPHRKAPVIRLTTNLTFNDRLQKGKTDSEKERGSGKRAKSFAAGTAVVVVIWFGVGSAMVLWVSLSVKTEDLLSAGGVYPTLYDFNCAFSIHVIYAQTYK